MHKNSSKRLGSKGFSHFELGLLIVVIAVITGVGFFVYSKNNNKSKADSAMTENVAPTGDTTASKMDNGPTPAPDPGVAAPVVEQPELDSTTAPAANQRMARKSGKPNAAYGVEYDTTHSGYRLEGNGITARLNYVSGTVNVPTVYCGSAESFSFTNVDLGNYSGTEAQSYIGLHCIKAKAYYYVGAQLWLGDNKAPSKSFPDILRVKPGDKVSMEITRKNGKFVYDVKNLTTKRFNSVSIACSKNCETRDANWVVARQTPKYLLAKNSDIVYTNVKAGPDGWPVMGLSQYSMPPWKVVTIDMTDGGSRYLSVPSNPLGGDGQSFRVQFVNSK
ncbi:MAG: G1 family glutamic endopeptidase [bacterium]